MSDLIQRKLVRYCSRVYNAGKLSWNMRAAYMIAMTALFGIASALPCCSPRRSAPWNWHSVHADGRNSDYSPVAGPKRITLAWQRKFEGTINLGATNDKAGRVFITTSAEGCHLYALDASTGATIWCTEEVNELAVASSALVDEQGHVFIADNEHMHAFDRSGNLVWETPIDGFPLSAQFTTSGRLIFITHIGVIYVLDKTTGKAMLAPEELTSGNRRRVASFDPHACMRGTKDCPCANTLAVDEKTGRFYFTYWEPGSAQADLLAMRYAESPVPALSRIWRNSSLPGGSASSPDISFDGRTLYVNDNVGTLHAIDAETGENIWRFDLGYATGGSQSTAPNGTIVPAGGALAPLMCIQDKGDHAALRWRKDSVFNRGVATQTAGGLIYATIADNTRGRFYNQLAVIEAESGKLIDQEELPGLTFFTVGTTVGPEGNIYVPSFNGTLFAFKPEPRAGAGARKRPLKTQ